MDASTNEMMGRIRRTLVGGTVVTAQCAEVPLDAGSRITVPWLGLDSGAGFILANEFEDFEEAKAFTSDLVDVYFGATIENVVIHEFAQQPAIGVIFANCTLMLRLRGVFPKDGDTSGWHYELCGHPLTRKITRVMRARPS